MKIVSNLIRAAAFAAFALGASALVPTSDSEAQAQSGWSQGNRAQSHRGAPRPAVRHRHVAPRHAAPRRVHRRPAARHYGPRVRPMRVAPQRCVIRSRWVNTYQGRRLVQQRICRPRW